MHDKGTQKPNQWSAIEKPIGRGKDTDQENRSFLVLLNTCSNVAALLPALLSIKWAPSANNKGNACQEKEGQKIEPEKWRTRQPVLGDQSVPVFRPRVDKITVLEYVRASGVSIIDSTGLD